jgi:ectoine hydroxylase-related dioxygenase (phytanoyl-CoA dioxygenase family)
VSYADAGDGFELVPDIDAERERHRIVSFDIEPGDLIAFHFRVLHDAPGTEALTHGRRAVSFRWLGDDATFALRPWLHSPPFEPRSLTVGGPLDDDRFPLVD